MRHLRSMDMCWTEYLLIGLNLCILQAAFGLDARVEVTVLMASSNWSRNTHGWKNLIIRMNEYSQNFHPPRAVPLKRGLPIHKWEIHSNWRPSITANPPSPMAIHVQSMVPLPRQELLRVVGANDRTAVTQLVTAPWRSCLAIWSYGNHLQMALSQREDGMHFSGWWNTISLPRQNVS